MFDNNFDCKLRLRESRERTVHVWVTLSPIWARRGVDRRGLVATRLDPLARDAVVRAEDAAADLGR